MRLTVTTWNINSVRLRLDLVLRFLGEARPDVLCLQETKCPDDAFPRQALAAAGYPHAAYAGQKGYNGVAILSKRPIADAGSVALAGTGHARHVAARLDCGAVVHNVYLPAGGPGPPSDGDHLRGPGWIGG